MLNIQADNNCHREAWENKLSIEGSIGMARGCCHPSRGHASIELLPQPSLPVLLDGFAGPISDSDSGDRQMYVTWSQVQCFLRMAEEALRAKNLAHDVGFHPLFP